MGAYQSDRAFSDSWIPELRRLIGPHLIGASSLEQDRSEAADLVVLRARDVTIACRVRRPGYAEKYPRQFTLRSYRENGTQTELSKIIDGWGDWFFYGHSRTDRTIDPWWLIDLHAFRAALCRDGYRQPRQIRSDQIPNGDGTWFRSYYIDTFPSHSNLIIAQQSEREVVTGDQIRWTFTL